MKSSMNSASHTGMIIRLARFHPVSFVTGQVMTFKRQIINTSNRSCHKYGY
ncbi:hypothetical protein [Algoriphagus persicinus]|uniref:hypothetical protein n=1 Tax=Algoriphagus persicinus TaxID=3108754 RepID=UPI002B3E85D3|nr:hypothetical protein [Algoriphagus sp. E1-3-M2]MEB2784119.1 hypothetical protein [Algoriphagus sp. E1-3-M2]